MKKSEIAVEVISTVDNSITIHYYGSRRVEISGYHLSKNGIVDTPLSLIKDDYQRQLVMAEASDLTWPKKSQNVKVTYENGDNFTTSINGSRLSTLNYYLNNKFNIGDHLPMATVVKIEFLN